MGGCYGKIPCIQQKNLLMRKEMADLSKMTKEELAKYLDYSFVLDPADTEEVYRGYMEEVKKYKFGALCLLPYRIPLVVAEMGDFCRENGIKIGGPVGFPYGQHSTATKVFEALDLVKAGATQLDMATNVAALKEGKYDYYKREPDELAKIGRDYHVMTKANVLINNAAVLPRDHLLPFEEISIDAILDTLNVNSLGALRMAQKCYKMLKKGRNPIVVNISSAGASFKHIIEWDDRQEYPYGYCMSKAALNMGSAILQRYSKLDGIRVICVHPGLLDTWMNAGNPFGETLMPTANAAELLYHLTERERKKDAGALFFNFDGEIFPY